MMVFDEKASFQIFVTFLHLIVQFLKVPDAPFLSFQAKVEQ